MLTAVSRETRHPKREAGSEMETIRRGKGGNYLLRTEQKMAKF